MIQDQHNPLRDLFRSLNSTLNTTHYSLLTCSFSSWPITDLWPLQKCGGWESRRQVVMILTWATAAAVEEKGSVVIEMGLEADWRWQKLWWEWRENRVPSLLGHRHFLWVCVYVCVRAAGCCASTDALISQTGPPLWEPHQPAHFDTINPACTISLNSAGKKKKKLNPFFLHDPLWRSSLQ